MLKQTSVSTWTALHAPPVVLTRRMPQTGNVRLAIVDMLDWKQTRSPYGRPSTAFLLLSAASWDPRVCRSSQKADNVNGHLARGANPLLLPPSKNQQIQSFFSGKKRNSTKYLSCFITWSPRSWIKDAQLLSKAQPLREKRQENTLCNSGQTASKFSQFSSFFGWKCIAKTDLNSQRPDLPRNCIFQWINDCHEKFQRAQTKPRAVLKR